jgi:BlaI family transcriptional regulator, penicillinase repressor
MASAKPQQQTPAPAAANPPRLGKMQLRIMQVLWQHREATARQITEELSRTRPIAHSTVQTLLRQMEAKGAVCHDVQERVFVFRPLYQQSEVSESVALDLLNRVFEGSVYGLVAHLFKNESVSPEELTRLRELIDAQQQERKGTQQ